MPSFLSHTVKNSPFFKGRKYLISQTFLISLWKNLSFEKLCWKTKSISFSDIELPLTLFLDQQMVEL